MSADPIFLKRRLLPYGLRDLAEKEVQNLVQQGILTPVESSKWATPIVTPLKSNGLARICSDYHITVNKNILHKSTSTLEPEDLLNLLHGSTFF